MKIEVAFAILVFAAQVAFAEPPQCIECHKKTTRGIVNDWQLSKHAQSIAVAINCVP